VSKLIQKELGDIFQREGRDLLGNTFITITKVTVSPDLSLAKIYLSFMLVEDKKGKLEEVKAQTKVIRKLLGQKIKQQVRIIPDLNFYIDDNLDYAAKMDELFSKITIPPAPDETEDNSDEEE
jgi:ribosome-binding factor A